MFIAIADQHISMMLLMVKSITDDFTFTILLEPKYFEICVLIRGDLVGVLIDDNSLFLISHDDP